MTSLAQALATFTSTIQAVMVLVFAQYPAATLRQLADQAAAAAFEPSALGDHTLAVVHYGPKGTDGQAVITTVTAEQHLSAAPCRAGAGWEKLIEALDDLSATPSDTASVTITRRATAPNADHWDIQYTP